MAFRNQDANVRVAAVVDVLRPAPACRTVDGPVVVQREKVNHGALLFTAALGFTAIDPLARVLDDFAIPRDILAGKQSIAMDAAALDLQLVDGVIDVDFWFSGAERLNGGSEFRLGVFTRWHSMDCKR